MAITIRQLREDLQALLHSELGEYTLPNGVKTPAVAVRSDNEGLASGTQVDGLELVINRHYSPDPVRQYLEEQVQDVWEVWLLAWDPSSQINEAAAHIIYEYPGTTAQVISLPEAWGPARQIRLELLCPSDHEVKTVDVDGGNFKTGIALVFAAAVLDGGNYFDGSTLNTYTGTADGGVFA